MKERTVFGFNIQKLSRWVLYWGVVGAGAFVLMFLITGTWIGVSVHDKCLVARSTYGGDCVEALMETVIDESNSLRIRNYGIWALGQLGDRRARSTLKVLYTGNIPDREPYDEVLSQYELQKALKLLESGVNITAPLWRNLIT